MKKAASSAGSMLGATVRAKRLALELSLSDLSDRSGVSRAMLSEIERDLKSPTIRVACQVADALGVPLSALVRGRPAAAPAVVTPDERRTLIDPITRVRREILSDLLLRHGIEVLHYDVPPHTMTGVFPPHRTNTLENITVLAGRVSVTVGEHTVDLRKGDSISYEADATHAFENRHATRATMVVIIDSSHTMPH
jgi:XRE family transcriptional regulator, regulator of sulfur utilization